MGVQSDDSVALAERRAPSRWRWMRHAWVLGFAIYGLAIYLIGWEKLYAAAAGTDLRWCAATVALLAAAQWLRALKWRAVLGKGQHAIGVHFLSKLGGNYTPGRLGEFAPLLIKRHRGAKLAAWIALDRVLEIIFTAMLGLWGLSVIGLAGRGFMGVTVVLICAPSAFIAYAMWDVQLARRIAGLLLRLPLGERIESPVRRILEELHLLRGAMPAACLLTLVCAALDLAIGAALWRCFGHPLPFALLATMKLLYAVVASIPWAPSATGVPMLSVAALLYQVASVPEADIAAAVALSTLLTHLVFWPSFWLGTRGLISPEESKA